MANTDKMAIMAVMTWLHMAMNMDDIGVFAKNRENVVYALYLAFYKEFRKPRRSWLALRLSA